MEVDDVLAVPTPEKIESPDTCGDPSFMHALRHPIRIADALFSPTVPRLLLIETHTTNDLPSQ